MAEAHHATSYSTSLTHELPPHKIKGKRATLRQQVRKIHNKILNWIYPAHLEGLVLVTGIVTSLYFGERRYAVGVVNRVVQFMPGSSLAWQLTACSTAGFTCWFAICLSMKTTLRLLLSYQGYMFEGRGKKVSLRTKIWAILLKAIHKWNPPRLYSFQRSLPTLPVPSLDDTIRRYLRSVQPILDDENFKRVEGEAKEFQNGIGRKLQRYVWARSWWADNYVSDWWEEYIYLRNKSPLMINSNVYCSDNIAHPSKIQSARAANIIYQFLKFREEIDNESLPPILAQGMVPLCSWQYKRLFNTTRIPGLVADKVVHFNESHHLAIYHKGRFFKLIVYRKGKLLNPREIQYQLEWILNSTDMASHAETYMGALTSWNRLKWAEVRDNHFSSGINKTSLNAIESAAFMITLNDEPFEMELVNLSEDREELHKYSRLSLHGKVYDFWFDKSFCINVGTNGRFTFNGEHSWADAPIISRMLEEAMVEDITSYDADGNPKGEISILPPKPIRLEWDFSSEQLVTSIDSAYADGVKMTEDLDIQNVVHNAFGKGFIKTCNLSPDAFIQMALQLAYFRDFGKFSLTYEASMTRLFLQGRTETVRSCTIESSAWVRAMEDEQTSTEERVSLLKEACQQHQKGYLEAMTGQGVDRHLFCLYVVSKYLEIESPFLKEVISEPWRLSTSQTPHGQTSKIDLKKNPELKGCAGGFGPVAHDGYSVSYIISGEDRIYFHISSVKSCPLTSTDRFGKRVCQAMDDMKKLMEEFKKVESKKKK